ncbi:hypothetical protein BCAR13_410038 [Paraburkholderia caribensis]|nr:hypothetical protein BCAR13_410038 [Paraburkholderia caribensis]
MDLRSELCAFFPVHVYDPSPGCYMQFPRERDRPWCLSLEQDLFYLRHELTLQMARRLAGGTSSAALGRLAVRPGVSFESGRRRWAHFERALKNRTLSNRVNSIAEACKRDIQGRNDFVDRLLKGDELVWQLVGHGDCSSGGLQAQLSLWLTSRVCVASRVETEAQLDLLVETLCTHPCSVNGWNLLNILFFRLCRAQSRGDVDGYGRFYHHILYLLETIGYFAKGEIYIDDFSKEYRRFFQDWYSRIRIASSCYADLVSIRRTSHVAKYGSTWQVIEPDLPERQISEGYPDPSDKLWKEMFRRRQPYNWRAPSSANNLINATRHIRRHPEILRRSWCSITVYRQLRVTGRTPIPLTFDGCIRRRHDSGRRLRARRRVNVRRHVLARSRRGPRARQKRRTLTKLRPHTRLRRQEVVRGALRRPCRSVRGHIAFSRRVR